MKNFVTMTLSLFLVALACNAAIAGSNYWNDMARFLAGLPIEESSEFYKLTNYKSYDFHKKKMDEFWEKVEKGNIAQITQWQIQYIQPHFNHGTVFYPLCGGDFINMYIFFPNARRYIMISREPEGKIPNLLSLKECQLAQGLAALRNCIWSIASVNYFVTKAMRSEMKNKYLGGTLPVYLIFAARLGLFINKIEPIGITKKGILEVVSSDGTIKGELPTITGNRIYFSSNRSKTQSELIYLSMYITPELFQPNTPSGIYLSFFTNLNVILKSAIYLFHRPSYEPLVRALLERTDILIEDDSGIPFRYINFSVFSIKLFGYFDKPVRLKEIPNPPQQPDLAEAIKMTTTSLPFSFGYGVLRKDRKSHLILAIRKR